MQVVPALSYGLITQYQPCLLLTILPHLGKDLCFPSPTPSFVRISAWFHLLMAAFCCLVCSASSPGARFQAFPIWIQLICPFLLLLKWIYGYPDKEDNWPNLNTQSFYQWFNFWNHPEQGIYLMDAVVLHKLSTLTSPITKIINPYGSKCLEVSCCLRPCFNLQLQVVESSSWTNHLPTAQQLPM